ncbi:MAG: single-stranded-DNA-specific exonuclease RecJ, partial [Oscillospiraceae bacterium]|nr:single-stranded-DNA-specific exonuclease RecJ [Oscillospiraceae bacterium]
QMCGMPQAVQRIRQAIAQGEAVAVYGDYDVDGITATCLVTDYLRYKGLRCIGYIPDRNEEGYGLNCAALDALYADGVRLLITVDCGITAVEEALHTRQLGLDMIITDHHECKPGELPDALAVIDCKQEQDHYPDPGLAGVGVAMKLICACEGDSAWVLDRYADLVAVGTVADVMPLVGENRALVLRGLKKLAEDPRPGFAAMFRETSVDPERITAASIGFSLAPRLNAAGRLGQATKALDLLMCSDPEEASRLAAELCELNRQRQAIETEIWQDAQAELEHVDMSGPIVLASDRWHQGVIGIAASRLAEQFSLPAIMVCLNGDHGKGSCRSYGGFNLFEALSACSEHLLGFGGHALAAGMTIRRDKLADFRAALREYFLAHRPVPQPEVSCDILIREPELLSTENVRELDRLEPYGNANPRPVFCLYDALLASTDQVGNGRHLRMRLRIGHSTLEGIFFSKTAQALGITAGDRVDLAFTPQINEFRGHSSVQLVVNAIRRHDPHELCRAILDDSEHAAYAACVFRPERSDFVRIWKVNDGVLSLPADLEGILASCPREMEPERYCLCLMVWLEAGLLQSTDGSIYGAHLCKIEGKADLNATKLMRALQRETRSSC